MKIGVLAMGWMELKNSIETYPQFMLFNIFLWTSKIGFIYLCYEN